MTTKHVFLIAALFVLTLLPARNLVSTPTPSSLCQQYPGYFYPNNDTDGDGLKDWEEDRNENCVFEPDETIPYYPFSGYDPAAFGRTAPAGCSSPTQQVCKDFAKDTDGDGIRDLYEYFNSASDHAAYREAVGALAAQQQAVKSLSADQKRDWFRCPLASNPFNCDGASDGSNAADLDADNDGLPDAIENCGGDLTGTIQVTPDGTSGEEDPYPSCQTEARIGFLKKVAYLWQETNPYLADSDGDGTPEGLPGPGKDLCPADNTGDGDVGVSDGNFECVRRLCIGSAIMETMSERWDTDSDGRKDIKEDQNLNCTVNRHETSLESDPFNPNSDYRPANKAKGQAEVNDMKVDGDDECPLDSNVRCRGVCQRGRHADGKCYAKNAIDESDIDRHSTDYDGDGIVDSDEDSDCNCDYDGPLAGELVSRETDWQSADTDGDVAQFAPGVLGVGNDRLDECPHLDPAEDGSEAQYPHCLVYYCNPAMGRLEFKIGGRENVDTDGDGIKDTIENPDRDCRQGESPLELDPLNPDTDGDGIDDGSDSCPHAANVTVCPDLCPEGQADHPLWSVLDSDNDGLKNSAEDANGDCERGVYESDPFLADTDGDGMSDYSDACPWNPDPSCLQVCDPDTFSADADSDGDGLKNGEEDADKNCIYFGVDVASGGTSLMAQPFDTSPYLRDSDGDGVSDRVDGCQESPADAGIAPDLMVPVSVDEADCARNQCLEAQGRKPGDLKDSDRDGIPDLKEDLDYDCIVSIDPNSQVGETDRFNPDTDADGILDGVEDKDRDGVVDEGETNPRAPDTDSDGIVDGVEDRNHNGKVDFSESDPKKPDSDGDTIPDNIEDRNLNGIWDGGQTATTGPCVPDGIPETSTYLTDSDLDNQPDNMEDLNKNGIFTNIGFDGDFSSASEFGETHPCNADTDGDGLFDGQEDKNHNGVLDLKEGETSPISPSTFGEPDMNRAERRVGIGGCSLVGARVAPSTGKAGWSLPLNGALLLVTFLFASFRKGKLQY